MYGLSYEFSPTTRMAGAWKLSSWIEDSLTFKMAAALSHGLDPKGVRVRIEEECKRAGTSSPKNLQDLLTSANASLAHVLVEKAFAEELARCAYGDEFYIYRGLTGEMADKLLKAKKKAKPGQKIRIKNGFLSSFSKKWNTAKDFDGAPTGCIIRKLVHPSDVWYCDGQSNTSHMEESEVVISTVGRGLDFAPEDVIYTP
jgi:hypothetical protein